MAITAPTMSATKQAAASPVRRGTNIAIAPASSSAPMMYTLTAPMPMAANPAMTAGSLLSLPAAANA
ncbi:hypothetical protein BJF90_41570 [Pseudonocardia sp. CNS-004]|nr:hypothetical protein BJF90_41570 [Pseudonocardia sp. CNS-004]